MKRKNLIITFLIVALFYSFIFILSRHTNPLFFMGTGWKFYKFEDKRVVSTLKVHQIKKGERTFLKNVKIYPECSGILHEDIKEKLLSFSFDDYLFIPLRMVVPNPNEGDEIVVKFEEEVVKGDAINYIFGFPVRVEKIELRKPTKFISVEVVREEG